MRTAGSVTFLCLSAPCLVLVSAGAAGQAPFTEEASLRGLEYVATQTVANGRGLAFVDLDDDGDADVVTLGDAAGTVGIFENDGTGHFTDRSPATGIPALPDTSGVIAGDYDRDGDLDLYVSRWNANVLLRNDGGFTFTDVTAAAGVADPGKGHGCAWGDYDHDGRLDLYVANQDGPNLLYRNRGDGTFEDVAARLGVDLDIEVVPGAIEGSFQAGFLDFDRDGDADLYVSKIKGYCSDVATSPGGHLFENVGGTFTEITLEAGAEACVDAMCLAIGDFDGNGFPDLYQTGVPTGNSLLLNQGDGTFAEEAELSGTVSYALGWGAVFFDHDNDGFTDLYVCNTFEDERLYRHDGRWPCEDVADAMGLADGGRAYTCAIADIEGDGDVDLLVQVRDEPVRLYVNHADGARRWARFDVTGEGASHRAIGAVIEVRTGGTRQVREVIAGSNYKNQNELVQHFGLGAADMIDEVSVVWPGGTTRVVTSLPADRRWTLFPPDKLGDGDHDGDRDLVDFFLFAACWTDHDPGALAAGCEMMDYEGDGDVDGDDFVLLLAEYDGEQPDCNGNGVVDLVEILEGTEDDENRNGLIDACEHPGDVDGTGSVDAVDLLLILQAWGPCPAACPPACAEDADGDCMVGEVDLLAALTNWG